MFYNKGHRTLSSRLCGILAAALMAGASGLAAQTPEVTPMETPKSSYEYDFRGLTPEQVKDSLDRAGFEKIYEYAEEIQGPVTDSIHRENLTPYQVVTHKCGKNWFLFGTYGYHSFRGDYSNLGNFKGTLSPDWSVGIGKWFTPGVALKIEFIKSNSQGYTEYLTGHYGQGPILIGSDNTPYRKMRTDWWDISGSVILNLTRLFMGYEGVNSPKRMNQFMFTAGIGGVHHLGYEHSHGSDNEWSGHLELQYSRFFTRAKRFSLDFKVRGIFYQTNFDLEYGQADHAAHKWDCNVGLDVGFTFYLDSKRSRGWKTSATHTYTSRYNETHHRDVYVIDRTVEPYSEITFYVFYPNNYSGRNDAPQVKSSVVHAIDYLTGGINTQKRYVDTEGAMRAILDGLPLDGRAIEDFPTESASNEFELDGFPRGYEMGEGAISLPFELEAMEEFAEKAGFSYAPIYGDPRRVGKIYLWHYRIDDATLDQKLLADPNYYEDKSFGLNANEGLPYVQAYFGNYPGQKLVSLADMYAALNGNTGHIADHTNAETVREIREILDNAKIQTITLEGFATSQDNYSGANAAEVGRRRNNELSTNRAYTVRDWLLEYPEFHGQQPKVFDDLKPREGFDPSIFNNAPGSVGTAGAAGAVGRVYNNIGRVDDASTRDMLAKMNRCVKVRIQFLQDPTKKAKARRAARAARRR